MPGQALHTREAIPVPEVLRTGERTLRFKTLPILLLFVFFFRNRACRAWTSARAAAASPRPASAPAGGWRGRRSRGGRGSSLSTSGQRRSQQPEGEKKSKLLRVFRVVSSFVESVVMIIVIWRNESSCEKHNNSYLR